jgi:hypothetical protein
LFAGRFAGCASPSVDHTALNVLWSVAGLSPGDEIKKCQNALAAQMPEKRLYDDAVLENEQLKKGRRTALQLPEMVTFSAWLRASHQ